MEATLEAVVEHGLDGVSLRKVAARLDVTAPALYAHVRSKDDLLRSVAEVALGELITRFEAVPDGDPIDRMRGCSRAYVDFALDRPELYRTLFLFPPRLDAVAPTGRELALATSAFELPARAVAEAVEQGHLDPPDAAMAPMIIWTAVHGVAEVLRMGLAFDEASRGALLDAVLDVTLAGLGGPPVGDAPDPPGQTSA